MSDLNAPDDLEVSGGDRAIGELIEQCVLAHQLGSMDRFVRRLTFDVEIPRMATVCEAIITFGEAYARYTEILGHVLGHGQGDGPKE